MLCGAEFAQTHRQHEELLPDNIIHTCKCMWTGSTRADAIPHPAWSKPWGTGHCSVKAQDHRMLFRTMTDETKAKCKKPVSTGSPAELEYPVPEIPLNTDVQIRCGLEWTWTAVKADVPPNWESSRLWCSHFLWQEGWLISYTAAVITTLTALKCQPSNVTFCRSIIFIHRAANFGGC